MVTWTIFVTVSEIATRTGIAVFCLIGVTRTHQSSGDWRIEFSTKKSRPWAPRLRAFLCHDSISEKTKTIVDFTHQKPLTGQGSK